MNKHVAHQFRTNPAKIPKITIFAVSGNALKIAILSFLILSCCLLPPGNLSAKEKNIQSEQEITISGKRFSQALNMCPASVFMGIFSMNYELFVKSSHGFVARIDYEAVPKDYTDAKLKTNGLAFILNYRWHFSGAMESFYVGTYLRYREYFGTGTLGATKFDFRIPEQTLGLNFGKRWVWDNGFNLNLAFGYGIIRRTRDADPSSPAIRATLDDFEDEYDFIDPFLGEFSIGYTF